MLLFTPALVQVWDQDGVVIIPDHYIFTADPRANRNVDILRDFVNQQASHKLDCCDSPRTFSLSPVTYPHKTFRPMQIMPPVFYSKMSN